MSRSLDLLHPLFRPRVLEWLDDCAIDPMSLKVVVTCTIRTFEEQAVIWTWGRTVQNPNFRPSVRYPLGPVATKAKPGESAHQYGLAVDAYPTQFGKLVLDGKSPLFTRMIELGIARNMVSLQPFEYAHLEMPNWRNYIGG
jgi:hypothetical protein